MKIHFKKDNEAQFWELWNKYREQNPSTVRYTAELLDYYKLYIPHIVDDLSFVVLQDHKPVGLCFLPLEKVNSYVQVALNGAYVPAPLASDRKAEKFLFSAVFELAKQHNIALIRFLIDPLLETSQNTYNFLTDYGFLDTSETDGIIDLRRGDLWEGLRKGHRYSIKEIKKDSSFSIHIMDYKNADHQVHEVYRELHRLCSGRVTRSIGTFEKQFEMLQKDQAALIGLKHGDRFVGFSNFMHTNGLAVYASSADDPAYTDEQHVPVSHATIWATIEYYKGRGFKKIDLSLPFSLSAQFGEHVDAKIRNIANFKRGFGAARVPCFRGALYFDPTLFKADIERFKEEYSLSMVHRSDHADPS